MQKGRQIAPVTPGRGPKWVNPGTAATCLAQGRSQHLLKWVGNHPKPSQRAGRELWGEGLKGAATCLTQGRSHLWFLLSLVARTGGVIRTGAEKDPVWIQPKNTEYSQFFVVFSLFSFGFSWNSHFSQGRDAKKNLSRIQHKNTEYSQVFVVFWWFSIVFPIKPPKKIRSELAPKTLDFRWPKGFWYLFLECLGGPKDFDVFRGSWTFSSFSYCFLSIENHWFLLKIDDFWWDVLSKIGNVHFWGKKTAGGSAHDSHLGFKSHLYPYWYPYLYPYLY